MLTLIRSILLLSILTFSSCATFSRSECEKLDWRNYGRQTALEGETLFSIQNKFEKDCHARHGVPVNQAELEAGFKAGTQEFCSPDSLRNYVAKGGEYRGTCSHLPPDTVNAGLSAGRVTRLEHQLRSKDDEIRTLQSKNSSLEREIQDLRSQVDTLRNSCRH